MRVRHLALHEALVVAALEAVQHAHVGTGSTSGAVGSRCSIRISRQRGTRAPGCDSANSQGTGQKVRREEVEGAKRDRLSSRCSATI